MVDRFVAELDDHPLLDEEPQPERVAGARDQALDQISEMRLRGSILIEQTIDDDMDGHRHRLRSQPIDVLPLLDDGGSQGAQNRWVELDRVTGHVG